MILEAIRQMDAEERRELTRVLFASKICVCEAMKAQWAFKQQSGLA